MVQYRYINPKRKAERAFRQRLFDAVRAARADTPDIEQDARIVARRLVARCTSDDAKRIGTLWGCETQELDGRVAALCGDALHRAIFDLALIGDLQVWSFSENKPELLLDQAERFGIDPAAIRKQLTAEQRKKPKRKKPKRKKPKRETTGTDGVPASTVEVSSIEPEPWPFPVTSAN